MSFMPGSRPGRSVSRLAKFADSSIGMVVPYTGVNASTPPAGWIFPCGQNLKRNAYGKLFTKLTKQAPVTLTVASPCVVSWINHGLVAGTLVTFETTGALPFPLGAGLPYYVAASGLTASSFQIELTVGSGSLSTSGAQSGVHTGLYAPFGDGDGQYTFGVPDMRGRVPAGVDNMGGASSGRLSNTYAGGVDGDFLGNAGGEDAHLITLAETPLHAHTMAHTHQNQGNTNFRTTTGGSVALLTAAGTNNGIDAATGASSAASTSQQATGGAEHTNIQPTLMTQYIMFTGVY